MARVRPFDEDDMSNFAFERFDDDEKTDEDLLNDWNTEGPEDEKEKEAPDAPALELPDEPDTLLDDEEPLEEPSEEESELDEEE